MADGIMYCPDDIPRCQSHSSGFVRRIVDADFYVINGERTRTPFRTTSIRYECAECGHNLWSSPPVSAKEPSDAQ